jgi:hypothetical protein
MVNHQSRQGLQHVGDGLCRQRRLGQACYGLLSGLGGGLGDRHALAALLGSGLHNFTVFFPKLFARSSADG